MWNKLSSHATTISGDRDGYTRIVYQRTTIVMFNTETIILNSGGWRTSTTKKKMNQAAAQFSLPYRVYQENFDWFVVTNGDWDHPIPFTDGMEIQR